MSVVVAYKWVANPQDATVSNDGAVDWSRAKATVSEYDPVAILLARQTADAAGEELVGISVGAAVTGSSMAKKGAMSRGMDRGVVVADDAVANWNITTAAQALAQLVNRVENAGILFTGESSIDENAKMVPALAAGYLGWPCLQDVTNVAKTDNGWSVTQNIEGGSRTVEVTGPVVVAVASDALTPKVPGMKEILAAGKKKVDQVAVSDLDLAQGAVEVESRAKPERKARKNKMFTGDDAPAQLVAALRADGLL